MDGQEAVEMARGLPGIPEKVGFVFLDEVFEEVRILSSTFEVFRAKSVPGRPGRPQGGIGTPESLIFLRKYWCFGPGRFGMRFFCHFH